ncbi:MAG TPA: glycoside hydrolase family 88 protein [Verrucomicrobiae bacterium]|jgi:rhamnogalacturonyl hydrolase YesR|nr:glycoside hydrolase family 88 protein [Verrucomicrobiae bacterium]
MKFQYLAMVVVLLGLTAQGQSTDSGGVSDAQIPEVVARVAKHQIRLLADGDYAAVTNLDAARAAKAPAGIAWNYPWGVALFGVEQESERNGDNAGHDFVIQHNLICARYYHWLAGVENQFGGDGKEFARGTSLKGLMAFGNLDSCGAMGNEMIQSMMQSPDKVSPEEKEVVERIANWVVHKQDRLPDGTLWRPHVMGGTVWPDDLYMGGVFLVRLGLYRNDPKLIDDAAEQIIHQAALEQDTDGLWYHGYFVAEKQHAPFKWGRGNGWAMVATVETLSAMTPKNPLRPKLLDILRRQIDGLKRVQAPDGAFRQVLDKPELWEETSCTAMFAYGIARAVNLGWIGPENMAMARKAFTAAARNVNADGAVSGTCQGTSIGKDLDYYINREHPADDPHGWGAMMLAGTELLGAAD